MGYSSNEYEIFEPRLKKPIAFVREGDPPAEKFALIFQAIDDIKINRNKKIKYFVPNNIALLLSNSDKALIEAKHIYKNQINPDKTANDPTNQKDITKFLKEKSSTFCDYIEKIQTGIVFSYTAVEAFANISIPEN
jgi:hypothetical protein